MSDDPQSTACVYDRTEWGGLDMWTRRIMTPLALLASVALAVWVVKQAQLGERIGDIGSLLVLAVFATMAAKLTAEMYLFSYLGEPSPKQRAAQLMAGPYARLTSARFLFGTLGGIVLPLSVQVLATGVRDIPAAASPIASAIGACVALACLVVGEILQGRLFQRTVITPPRFEEKAEAA